MSIFLTHRHSVLCYSKMSINFYWYCRQFIQRLKALVFSQDFYKNDYLVVTTNSNGKNHGICASEGDAIVRNLTTGEICLVPRKHFDVEYKAYDN